MENTILTYKKELIEWIKTLDDLEVLSRLIELKENDISVSKVCEPQMEYAVKDDFEERFANGIPHKEMKRRTLEYIENLPWKR